MFVSMTSCSVVCVLFSGGEVVSLSVLSLAFRFFNLTPGLALYLCSSSEPFPLPPEFSPLPSEPLLCLLSLLLCLPSLLLCLASFLLSPFLCFPSSLCCFLFAFLLASLLAFFVLFLPKLLELLYLSTNEPLVELS